MLARIFFVLVGFVLVLKPQVSSAASKDRELRSTHFIISYDESLDYDYVNRVKNTCEDYYRIISQEFRLIRDKLWLWENRAKIFIAKDKKSYTSRFKCPAWAAACVNYRDKVIYTYPGQQDFSTILMHELTHIIFREYVGTGNFPLWLDEGVSIYMEDKYAKSYRKKRDLTVVKEALRNNQHIKVTDLNDITVSTLGPKPLDYVNLYYLESFSMVSFIIKKYGRDRFAQFLSFLRKGDDYQQALSKAIYSLKGWEDLERKWKKFYQE